MNLQPSSCTKKTFDTIEAAQAFAVTMEQLHGDTQVPYMCPECGKYHNTSRPHAPFTQIYLPTVPDNVPSQKRFSEKDYQEWVSLHAKGKRPDDIAKQFGCTSANVYYQLRKRNLLTSSRQPYRQQPQPQYSQLPLTSESSIDQLEARANAEIQAAQRRLEEARKAREALKQRDEVKVKQHYDGSVTVQKYNDDITLSKAEWASVFERMQNTGAITPVNDVVVPIDDVPAPVAAVPTAPTASATKKFAWNLGVLK